MNAKPMISGWKKGRVDRRKDHFELRYGSTETDCWDTFIPVALIGPAVGGVVKVQFLVKRDDATYATIVSATEKEIQFYLVDKHEEDPWAYAIYHCGTAANVYSSVHWSFFHGGKEGSAGRKAQVNAGD